MANPTYASTPPPFDPPGCAVAIYAHLQGVT